MTSTGGGMVSTGGTGGGATGGNGGGSTGGRASGGAPDGGTATGGTTTGGASSATGGTAGVGQAGRGAGGTTSTGGGGGHTATGGTSVGGGGPGPEAASCATSGMGLTTCGPNGDESCCAAAKVAGGMFYRTYTNGGSGATGKMDAATVSDFRLDEYEVTVGRFRQYVNHLASGGSPPAAGSGKHTHLNGGKGLADAGKPGSYETGWDASWNQYIPNGASALATWTKNLGGKTYSTWTMTAGANEMLPLTFPNWYEAYAFCIWDGGFLPSEAEWKYAAAGGDELRMYPWGSTNPGSDSRYAIYDCYYPTGKPGMCASVANVPKVGSTPMGIGKYGQWDLAGSVWEWVLDTYAAYVSPCEDCARLTGGTNRVMPGGGFHTGLMPYLLSSNRQGVNYDPLTYRGDYGVGLRCARAP